MLLIKNGKIETVTQGVIQPGSVFVDNGVIVEVGTDEQVQVKVKEYTANGDADVQVIDAKGLTVYPGLIDAHCHIGMWEDSVGDEGAEGNEDTDPVMPQLRAVDGLFFMDKSFVDARNAGITTCVTGPGSANAIGGVFAAVKTDTRRINKMVLKESVAMKIALGQNPKMVYSDKSQTPSTRMATVALIREAFMKAIDYKEDVERHQEDPSENSKPDYDIKSAALIDVLNGKLPVKVHAHRADDILTAIRLSKEFGFKLTVEHCTEGHFISDILQEENVGCICGPFMTDRSKLELKNLTPMTPGVLSNKGIKVAIMTDYPCTPIQYLPLCASIAAKYGMGREEALKAITINAAELTGIDDRVGSIEAGKDADLVIADGDILDIKTNVKYTIINGDIVYAN